MGTAIVCLTLAVLWWRVEPLLQRLLALREAEAARASAMPDKIRVPDDLMQLADAESEPWAKEQLRSSLREAYDELGDWDLVRSRIGITA